CWADPSCKQTVRANGSDNWQVTATQPTGNGSVRTGPELQQQTDNWRADLHAWGDCGTNSNGTSNCSNTPISSLSSLTSSYAETMPHNGQTIAEAAYDIWTNYPNDIMIWTDTVGRCEPGAYGGTRLGTATLRGQQFDVYRYGGPGEEIIFVLNGPGGAGTRAQPPARAGGIPRGLDWGQRTGGGLTWRAPLNASP